MMLAIAKYFGFEEPEGREKGHPQVLVSGNVVSRRGMPRVDYDNHARMFEKLGINPSIPRSLLIGSTALNSVVDFARLRVMPSGLVFPLVPGARDIIVVNAISPLSSPDPQAYFTDRLVFQASRMADSHRKGTYWRSAGELLVGRAVAFKFGEEVVQNLAFAPPLIGGWVARLAYGNVEFGTLDAKMATRSGLVESHLNDICFPVYNR